MKGEAAVAILASEGLAQVAVSCQHARRSFVPLSFESRVLLCLNTYHLEVPTDDLRCAPLCTSHHVRFAFQTHQVHC